MGSCGCALRVAAVPSPSRGTVSGPPFIMGSVAFLDLVYNMHHHEFSARWWTLHYYFPSCYGAAARAVKRAHGPRCN